MGPDEACDAIGAPMDWKYAIQHVLGGGSR